MRYQWSEDLATGNPVIDSEHKTLIKAVDDLVVVISSGKGAEELNKSLRFLARYTQTHFGHEESLQKESNYPSYLAHKVWHTTFVGGVNKLVKKFEAEGPNNLLVIELHKAITVLLGHIRTEDRKIADHIKAHKDSK